MDAKDCANSNEELNRERTQAHKTRREFLRTVAIAGGTVAASAMVPWRWTSAAPGLTGVLRIATYQDISQLDPLRSNDTPSFVIYDQIFERLLLPNEKMEPTPWLAERFTSSPDAKIWTFYLRKGVTFHDGGPLTAEDVKFSLDRILDPANASQKRSQIDMIQKVEAVDSHTVRITLQYSYSPFPATIAQQHIVSKAAAQKSGDQFTKNPIGSGPLQFVDWVTNDRVTLQRNPRHWSLKPGVERVVFRPIPEASTAAAELLSGGVDIVQNVTAGTLAQLRAAPNVTIGTNQGTSYGFFGFRMVRPPFTDTRFREAVYRAWNLDAAINAVFPPEVGRRAYAVISPPIWPDDTAYLKSRAYTQDTQRARGIFNELMGAGVMPRDYTIRVISLPDVRARLSEILVSSLQQAGVRASLQITDLATLINLLRTDENYIYSLVGGGGAPDPDQSLYWLFHTGGPHPTFLNLSDRVLDNRLLRARQAFGREARARLYTDIQRHVLLEKIYHMPAYYLNNTHAWSARVKGFSPSIMQRWNLATPWATVSLA
jgi:peptide/nickel transport system substrate-binding protein